MSLVPLTTLLDHAKRRSYAIGYFEAWDSYSLEAVCEAAEEERAPVILGFGCMMAAAEWLDMGGIETLAAIGRAVALRSGVPVALLLNEAQTSEQAVRGIEAGFTAVMLDTSAWPWELAVETLTQLVREAHARGVAVEAELGRLPDAVDGYIDNSRSALTDPARAADLMARTGADCLAVSFGNVHLLTDRSATVDLAHLEAIHRQVAAPLVVHGGSSFPADAVSQAIAFGAAKFNVGTVLKQVFLEAVRSTITGLPANTNVHKVLGSHKVSDILVAGKHAVKAKVRELIRLYGASGQATMT